MKLHRTPAFLPKTTLKRHKQEATTITELRLTLQQQPNAARSWAPATLPRPPCSKTAVPRPPCSPAGWRPQAAAAYHHTCRDAPWRGQGENHTATPQKEARPQPLQASHLSPAHLLVHALGGLAVAAA
jgi:hypothetical protein